MAQVAGLDPDWIVGHARNADFEDRRASVALTGWVMWRGSDAWLVSQCVGELAPA